MNSTVKECPAASSRVRTLVAGMGFMGAVHCKNLLGSAALEPVGIVEPRGRAVFDTLQSSGNLGNLDLPMHELRQIPVFSTLREALASTGAEAVILAVPLSLHESLALEALRLNLHVLLEKPFASDYESALRVIGCAGKTRKKLMIAHCVRFDPVWKYLGGVFRSGELGKLKYLYCRRATGTPTWGVWRDPEVRQKSGGAMMDLLIHDLDFIRSLGVIESWQLNYRYGEYRELALKLKNQDAEIRVHGGWLAENTPFSSEYIAEFECGSLCYHSFKGPQVVKCTKTGTEILQLPGSGYANELEYFGRCITDDIAPELCPPQESAGMIRLCRLIQNGITAPDV